MTVRTKFTDSIVVYAGTAEELADVADRYASGYNARPHGYAPDLFVRAATMLRTGDCPAIDLGAVRFYRDRRDGTPFTAPLAPEPDEAWERRQRSLGVLLRG